MFPYQFNTNQRNIYSVKAKRIERKISFGCWYIKCFNV